MGRGDKKTAKGKRFAGSHGQCPRADRQQADRRQGRRFGEGPGQGTGEEGRGQEG